MRSWLCIVWLLMISGMLGIGCRDNPTGSTAVPPTVIVANPVTQTVTDYLNFTGNTAATDSVTLVARVEGYLEKVHFKDGAPVKRGDLLFTIQQDQYKAQLEQANAQVAAQEAALAHAKTELVRYTGLFKEEAGPQTQVDQWQYERGSAAARLLRASASGTRQTEPRLHKIRAPSTAGSEGIWSIPGTLSARPASERPFAEIERSIRCTSISLSMSAICYASSSTGSRLRTSHNGASHPPLFWTIERRRIIPMRGASTLPPSASRRRQGLCSCVGSLPIAIAASFPDCSCGCECPRYRNEMRCLVPGDAVSFDQQGEYVLVVNEKNVVERRGIKTGSQVGGMLVVAEGLKP